MKKKKEIIRFKDLWKTYQMGNVSVHALRGVNLTINEGEFVSVMGPSGSGKSTAVNLIGCLDLPSKGAIFLEGINIANLSESKLAQIRGKKIGFIFQTFNLIANLSAIENVALPLIFQGVPKAEREKMATKYLEKVDLGDRMTHKPTEMSGGQRQRVAIARALANDPELILADEPTGNLDSKTGKMVMEILKKLNHEDGKTIVLVTHDQNLAKYAKRTVLLKDGMIVKD